MEIENLVGIKSYDSTQNIEIIDYIICRLKQYCKEIIKIKNPDFENKFNLLIGVNTELKNVDNAIILAGHIDTVPANEDMYNTNPYQATRVDDKIYGLGIIDMKSFFASIIENIETISNLSHPIILAITCDEETNLLGVNEVIKMLKILNIKPKLTIVGEPTNLSVCTESKSCYEYKIEIAGKSCHSSNPANGVNAIYIATKLTEYIERLSRKFKNTTLSVGKINGGEAINIVPSYCSISFDIRTNKLNIQEKCLQMLNKKISTINKMYKDSKISLNNLLAIPPLENKKDTIVREIINKFNLTENAFVGGCEAGYYQSVGGASILFGVGDIALCHKPNEFMAITDYNKYTALLLEMLTYVCEEMQK